MSCMRQVNITVSGEACDNVDKPLIHPLWLALLDELML